MDIGTIGCRAVVLKPPSYQKKGDLSTRGWTGVLIGKSSGSISSYDIWVGSEHKIVTSSSVLIDEEYFPRRGKNAYQPLTPSTRAPLPPTEPSLPKANASVAPSIIENSPFSSVGAAPSTTLSFLNLFSGSYYRSGGLSDYIRSSGWSQVDSIDNNPLTGERLGSRSHERFEIFGSPTEGDAWHVARYDDRSSMLSVLVCSIFCQRREQSWSTSTLHQETPQRPSSGPD